MLPYLSTVVCIYYPALHITFLDETMQQVNEFSFKPVLDLELC